MTRRRLAASVIAAVIALAVVWQLLVYTALLDLPGPVVAPPPTSPPSATSTAAPPDSAQRTGPERTRRQDVAQEPQTRPTGRPSPRVGRPEQPAQRPQTDRPDTTRPPDPQTTTDRPRPVRTLLEIPGDVLSTLGEVLP